MKKLLKFAALLLLVAGSFVSCENQDNRNNLTGTWIWEQGEVVVTLTFYPDEENGGKFYSTVTNEMYQIMFADNFWQYYKIKGDMLHVSINKFPFEIDPQNTWFIRQHTEEVLELEYAGLGPANRIGRYLFNKTQN